MKTKILSNHVHDAHSAYREQNQDLSAGLHVSASDDTYAMSSKPITLLGDATAEWPSSPDEATLETFPNRNPDRDYWVLCDFPEFCSLCPVTGQPDTARIRIQYQPAVNCIETKSLKFYLSSFRNHALFNEDIVNKILTDLSDAVSPVSMKVRGDFSARGGISLTAQAVYPKGADNAPMQVESEN